MKNIQFIVFLVIMTVTCQGQTADPTNNIPTQPSTPGNGGNGMNVECTAVDLNIEYVSSHKKKMKVVVSGPNNLEYFNYKATSQNKNDITQIEWKLGDGKFNDYWGIQPKNPWGLVGEAYIPASKLPATNDEFGSKHGQLEVSVQTVNGNGTFYGSDQNPRLDVETYFRKEDRVIEDDGLKVPNWFYFWSQIPQVQSLLTNVEGIKLYNKNTGQLSPDRIPGNFKLVFVENDIFTWPPKKVYNPQNGELIYSDTYGAMLFSTGSLTFSGDDDKNIWGRVIIGPKVDNFVPFAITDYGQLVIIIGPGCSQYFINKIKKEDPEGIEVFYSVILHELQHFKIFADMWQNGYRSDLDLDHDGYNDTWELSDEGKKYGFKVPDNNDKILLGSKSAGTIFEENLCNSAEINIKALNNNDWSFDPKNKIQGKNYKK